jgi:hypothetical protein
VPGGSVAVADLSALVGELISEGELIAALHGGWVEVRRWTSVRMRGRECRRAG